MTKPQATAETKRVGRSCAAWMGLCLLMAVLACGVVWTLAALWYQAPAAGRIILMAAAGIAGCALAFLAFRHQRLAWAGTLVLALVVGGWWHSIQPTGDREWAPDVAHIVTGRVKGSELILSHVRNFEWRTQEDFTPRWETRRYDLDTLRSVDLIISVWASPAIAHTLISFGFANGEHLVFSIEIRRQKGQAFSEIGGFFKEFELALIAADENDIVRLRTDARGETVSLFPLKVTPQQARELLLFYVMLGNRLAAHPEFYQTLTSNCTTVIFQLARLVEPGIPFDWRILLSGYLPDYLYDHGLLDSTRPLDEIRRAAIIPPQRGESAPFSAAIRTR